ncbi:MAG TPA: response regulator [Puia sp.]|nr:response regulator [Puia sp.]
MEKQYQKKVFIVDDDADDRQIIKEAFSECQGENACVYFESAQKLLSAMHNKEHPLPLLVLLDLNMPGLTGLQALKEIRGNSKFSQVPVVVLTTSNLPRDKASCYQLGASCFITKPDSFAKLVEIVNAISLLWLTGNEIP